MYIILQLGVFLSKRICGSWVECEVIFTYTDGDYFRLGKGLSLPQRLDLEEKLLKNMKKLITSDSTNDTNLFCHKHFGFLNIC